MFQDDEDSKDQGSLIKFIKKAVIAIFLLVAVPSIVPPLMGVEDSIGCWTSDDGCAATNPIITSELTGLIQIGFDTLRGGGAMVIIAVAAIKALQYQFIPTNPKNGSLKN